MRGCEKVFKTLPRRSKDGMGSKSIISNKRSGKRKKGGSREVMRMEKGGVRGGEEGTTTLWIASRRRSQGSYARKIKRSPEKEGRRLL